MSTLKTGDLAFYDCFGGPVPCKVLSIEGPSGPASSEQSVRVRLTATRGPWRRGEELQHWGLHVVPRDALRGNRILPYSVQAD
jgi:hypothetical protein